MITTEKLSLSAAVNLPSDLTGMSILDRGAISGLEAAVDTNSTELIQSQVSANYSFSTEPPERNGLIIKCIFQIHNIQDCQRLYFIKIKISTH